MIFPRKIEVCFGLPGIGGVKETYDLLNAKDIACWGANGKVYPQLSVRDVETITVPDDRVRAFKRLQRMRHKQATRLNLSLRKLAA